MRDSYHLDLHVLTQTSPTRRHSDQLSLDKADAREVHVRCLSVDLGTVRRHDRLVRPRRFCDEKHGDRQQSCAHAPAQMAMDAREEGRAGSGTAEDIDRHHFSFPCSATTMPKPISFRDRPEYSQSYRTVRSSFEMTLFPTLVCRLPVTSDRKSTR